LDGFGYGRVYQYISTKTITASASDPLDLRKINYQDTQTWKLVGGTPTGAQVWATVEDSSIDAVGALSLSATATGAIMAAVITVSVALAAGYGGLAVAGAGSVALNTIRQDVKAAISGDGSSDGADANTTPDVGVQA